MKVNEFICKKEQYPMNKELDNVGNVIDTETNTELIIGVHIHREVYSKMGYICNEDAPELLHACVCALFELIFEMPVIKTIVLTPELIYKSICEENEVTEEIVRYSAMALCALSEAFKGYLAKRKG